MMLNKSFDVVKQIDLMSIPVVDHETNSVTYRNSNCTSVP